MQTTDGRIYIQDIDSQIPNDRIEAQFIPEISFNRTADIDSLKIIGKNLPQFQYTGGKSTISMTLDFLSNDVDRRDALRKVKWLESLTFNDGLKSPPHRVIIIFGDWLKGNTFNVQSISYTPKLFHKGHGYYPTSISVTITFALEEEIDIPITASDIRAGAETIGGDEPGFTFTSTASSVRDAELNNKKSTQSGIPDLQSAELNKRGLRVPERSDKTKVLTLASDVVQWTKLGFSLVR